jgi:hypothetical protein
MLMFIIHILPPSLAFLL